MTPSPSSRRTLPWKLIAFVLLAAIFGGLYWQNQSVFQLSWLADRETELKVLFRKSPGWVLVVVFSVYVGVTSLSLPGASPMSLLIGWFFGFWIGLVLVSFASTLGATGAFLLSRFFFRDAFQTRFGDRLETFNHHLEREGPFYLFTLRLIPVVPFFVINAVMGLTRLRASTFAWVSQIGMLPGTAVYVYAGSTVPDLQTLASEGVGAVFSPSRLIQLSVAFALLGTFALLTRWLLRRFRPDQLEAAQASERSQRDGSPRHTDTETSSEDVGNDDA